MRIVLDAMGSDEHPTPELQAAVTASQRWGDPILLTGPRDYLSDEIAKIDTKKAEIEIVHAPEVVKMTDKPAKSAKGKAASSMAIGMELLKSGDADAFVTMGNTGAAMANALFRLGRIRGVKRPALGTIFPVRNGHAIVIDLGANADCRPIYLVQFAVLGVVYARMILKIDNPRVGLISNGEEQGKGNQLIHETSPLLERSGLNFIGNIEPKELLAGEVDVAVTDGFTGNVLTKTSEAVAKFLVDLIRDEIRSSFISTLGGILARSAFRRVGKIMDPSEYGAAPLLGVKGLVFIGHGRSDAKAIVNAIRVARESVAGNLLETIETSIRSPHPIQDPIAEVI
jgi:glycerol-3-phosphate acyltransferase PlsX